MSGLSRAGELLRLLEQLGYESALVGGHAVSLRTTVRFTRDFDFAVAVESDREAESLAFALQERDFKLHTVIEQEAAGVLGTLRFVDPTEGSNDPTVDLLFGSTGIECEIVAAATEMRLHGKLKLNVATAPYLIATKVLSAAKGRPNDLADLRALLTVADEAELEVAPTAVNLIAERGYHRERDLAALLEQHIEAFT